MNRLGTLCNQKYVEFPDVTGDMSRDQDVKIKQIGDMVASFLCIVK